MVPEEADQLSEKFDSLGQDGKRTLLLYKTQSDVEHDTRDAAEISAGGNKVRLQLPPDRKTYL